MNSEGGMEAGQTVTITLMQGEVYQFASKYEGGKD